MKSFKLMVVVLASFLSSLSATQAQAPVISSFSQNGVLVCTNLQPGTVASVEWASSLSGPWQTNWAGLDAVTVNSNTTISVSVPMFYRVRGVAHTNYVPVYTADGMALIPAGSFTMGDVADTNYIGDAFPTNVYVSAFYVDTNLVSYSQWTNIYSYAVNHGYGFNHAGAGKSANHPVQMVNWYDCAKWCNARSQQAGLTPIFYTDMGLTQVFTNSSTSSEYSLVVYPNWTAKGYRLPTEAEWEKAARGGLSGQRFPWGNTISESQANYVGDTSYFYDLGPNGYNTNFNTGAYPYTSAVGYFAPNGYGVYDMAGNVTEWCWDYWYAGTPYPTGSPYLGGSDPRGPASGTYRVMRGGRWDVNGFNARCAIRAYSFPRNPDYIIGFRCVRGQ
jgi:formylglycine-generating enzyme required for sulfatase activity